MSVKTYLSIIIFLLSTMIIIFFITVDYRAMVKDTEYKKALKDLENKIVPFFNETEDPKKESDSVILYPDNINFIIINGDTIQIK